MKIAKQQTGMILVIVLIFLFLLSLLAVSALNTSHLQLRMSQNFSDDGRLFEAAEIGLRTAEKKLMVGSHQMNIDGIAVMYSIETLPKASCVIATNHHKYAGIYYRITSEATWNKTESITLQTTYALPISQKCNDATVAVQSGRMSWRELMS